MWDSVSSGCGNARAHRALLVASMVVLFSLPLAQGIYGGEKAAEDAYPFMVHLYVGEPHDGIVCGGSLIAPTFVLTAGHCVVGDRSPREQLMGAKVQDMRALIGCVDLHCTDGEVIEVVAGTMHPDYNVVPYNHGVLAASNDIAVLELASPSSHAVARPATADDVSLYPAGTEGRVLGWGCTPDLCFPSDLMQVDVPFWSDGDCQAASNYAIMFHPETEICAGADGRDSCGGDSGGPLLVYDEDGPVIVGIVNYGALFEVNSDDPFAGFVPCGSGQHPGVYAEVSAYESFVGQFL